MAGVVRPALAGHTSSVARWTARGGFAPTRGAGGSAKGVGPRSDWTGAAPCTENSRFNRGTEGAQERRPPRRRKAAWHRNHLHDEGPAQGDAAGQGDPQGDLALVLPDGQDRRPGRQRRGQEHAAPHHGRRGQGLRRRGLRRRGHAHRFLPQEPQLDPKKTVLEIVEEAVAPQRAILQKYEDLSANWSDENADELGRLQDQIDAQNLWSWTATWRRRWTRCACRRARRT